MSTKQLEIDINCDMGESYGHFKIGNDQQIFPFITSCNIACGYHGGDPLHIEKTITLALKNDVQIGAHPSYPDLLGFGRRPMSLPKDDLKAAIKYQVAALKGLVESLGGKLSYVKPHGALYNAMADDKQEALAVVEGIKAIDKTLGVMGLAGSSVEEVTSSQGMIFIGEAFADRKYTKLGRLMPRDKANAVITSPQIAVRQILSIVESNKVSLENGLDVAVDAQSICIHGDNPAAVDILKALKDIAHKHSITIRKFAL